MKRSLQTAVVFAALGLMLSGATVCSAQIMVGSYREAAKDDTRVVSAANFAVGARNKTQRGKSLKFVAVERAEKQVVAGTNYRLCLTVKAGGSKQQATVVVFQNLKNKYELTNWTSGDCATASEPNTDSEISKFSGKPEAGKIRRTLTPDAVVKNFYATHDAGRSPFFQSKNRALVDRYFTKELADLIWKDALCQKKNGGICNLDFNVPYATNGGDRQDASQFKIGKPEYGEGNRELADVPVTFKLFNTKENPSETITILYRLEQSKTKTWKISDIYFPANEQSSSSLKNILSGAATDSEEEKIQGEVQIGKSDR